MRYINFHTHLHSMIDNTVEVRSLSTNDIAHENDGFIPLAFIPGMPSGSGGTVEHFKTISLQPNVIGIGEIGLDKTGPTLDVQSVYLPSSYYCPRREQTGNYPLRKAWDELVRMKKGYDTGTLQGHSWIQGQCPSGSAKVVKLGFTSRLGTILDSQSKFWNLEAIH